VNNSIPRQFLSLTEPEYAAGEASFASGRVRIGKLSLHCGQEFGDVCRNLQAVIGGGDVLAQASLPVTFVRIDENATDRDAIQRSVAAAAGIRGDELSVQLLDAASGLPMRSRGAKSRPIAACLNRRDISAVRGLVAQVTGGMAVVCSRQLSSITAIKKRLSQGQFDSPVLHLDVRGTQASAVLLTPDNILEVARIGVGMQDMLKQLMADLKLMYIGSALRLFNSTTYDMGDNAPGMASCVVKPLAEKLQAAGIPRPCYLFVSGLPCARDAVLTKALADGLGLTPLSPFVDIEQSGSALPDGFAAASLDLWHMLSCATSAPGEMSDLAAPPEDWTSILAGHSRATGPSVHLYRGLAYEPDEETDTGMIPRTNPSREASASRTFSPASPGRNAGRGSGVAAPETRKAEHPAATTMMRRRPRRPSPAAAATGAWITSCLSTKHSPRLSDGNPR
jgi:hypothetical protein